MQIEKGVPIPENRGVGNNPKQPSKYPWQQLEVGDSFAAEVEPDVLRASAYKRGRKYGERYVVRSEDGGSRCWRVA